MCKWVLVAEGPDVFIGLPCSWSPRQLWATAHCGCSGNQAWGPLQDQYEFITTELSFSSPPRSLCTVYGVRVSPGSPGWSVTSVPQLQEMLLPLPAKFWVCATFLFFFLFFFFPFFFPPSSFLLFLMLFFEALECPGTCYVGEADLIYPHRSTYLELQAWATIPRLSFLKDLFLIVCVHA